MKIQIEKQIEVVTDETITALNRIIQHALQSVNVEEFKVIRTEPDFFIYYGSSHAAIHEILPNGEKSERLLFITN